MASSEDSDGPEDVYIEVVSNLTGIGEPTAEDLYIDGAPTPDEWLTEDGDLIDIVQDTVHTRFHDNLRDEVKTSEFGFGNFETSDDAKAMGDHLKRTPNAIRSDESKQVQNVTNDYDEWKENKDTMDFVGADGGDPEVETDDAQTTFGATSFDDADTSDSNSSNSDESTDEDMFTTVAEYGDARIQAEPGDEYRLEVKGDTYEWSDESDTPDYLNVHENGISEVIRMTSPGDILIVAETIEDRRHVPFGAPYPMVEVLESGEESVGFETVSGDPTIEDHPKLILRILSEHAKVGNETYIDPDVIETYADDGYEGEFPEPNTSDSDDNTVDLDIIEVENPNFSRETVELVDGKYVDYDAFDAHINSNAHKLWAAKVTGHDPTSRYTWDMNFLPDVDIDGRKHYDVSSLERGDLLRVKAASHSKDKTKMYQVREIGDGEMTLMSVGHENAIEHL